MTYNETILWQRFMQGKGVMNNFEYLYRSHRFDKRDLEQYLEDVEAEDVICLPLTSREPETPSSASSIGRTWTRSGR